MTAERAPHPPITFPSMPVVAGSTGNTHIVSGGDGAVRTGPWGCFCGYPVGEHRRAVDNRCRFYPNLWTNYSRVTTRYSGAQ